jgi:hypothetical protein
MPGGASGPAPGTSGPSPTPQTTADYLRELVSEQPSKRLFAARVLRDQLRRHLRVETRANPDSIAYLEAVATLGELRARVPSACIAGLGWDNTRAPCADMLGWLLVAEAEGPLVRAAAAETRPAVDRSIQGALDAIRGARVPAPAAPGAPAGE